MSEPADGVPGRAPPASTTQAAFCATLVDEWVRAGVRHAVVAPGSRSTPLALALADRPELALHVVLDERSAAFCALGIGKATGLPAVVLCTSGTAATHFHAAVVEAGLTRVPMLVCTADRPPELHGVGAPQTIDQQRLFGPAVRWFTDPGVADEAARWSWRSLAARSVLEARAGGPVHLNLPFREPLVAEPGELPTARDGSRPWHDERRSLPAGGLACSKSTGVIVAGSGAAAGAAIDVLACGWPVLADPLSRLRRPGAICAGDALARCGAWLQGHRPEAVIHLGRPPASKALNPWLGGLDAEHVLVDPGRRWSDPERQATEVVDALAGVGRAPDGWLAGWQEAERRAQAAFDRVLADHSEPTEPGLARALTACLPDGSHLVVSSSMPVRDVEAYMAPRHGLSVWSNRGANGIDGVTSTALGVAIGRRPEPTWALLGDLAFLHDGSGLTGLAARGVDLTLVVVDNHGGGIFSFLPQASLLAPDRFEQLLGTPQDADLLALAQAHGIPGVEVDRMADLESAVLGGPGGVRLVLVRTDRAANVTVHADLHAAVGSALEGV
jgi:2-succinyl-5-enolpyruvyl-6-hydroxy-3-cyclohexene-1-carboxylate synthase